MILAVELARSGCELPVCHEKSVSVWHTQPKTMCYAIATDGEKSSLDSHEHFRYYSIDETIE